MPNTIALPALPEDRVYYVIGPGVWGKDRDFTVALKNAKKEFGRGRDWRYIVYDAHAKVRIDDGGGFVWLPDEVGGDEAHRHHPYHEVLRVGFPAPKPPKRWDAPADAPLKHPWW